MYINILKKDLKRKKTMNIIILLFIIMTSVFISSSANNLLSISNAMDVYIEKSEISDFISFIYEAENEKALNFAENNSNVESYICSESIILPTESLSLNNGEFDYSNAITVLSLETKTNIIFDRNNEEIKYIEDGKIMLSSALVAKLGIKDGDVITIQNGDFSKQYSYGGVIKDVLCGSEMMGLTCLYFSENDYSDIIQNGGFKSLYIYGINTDNINELTNDFGKAGISALASFDRALFKLSYVMDMIVAGMLLIVSVCLIIISVVILRFTIIFTLNEEFREIGVMKAIGINNFKIRGLYIVKYFAISIIGSTIGFLGGIPFGKMMIKQVSENIVMQDDENIMINFICSMLVVLIVVGFCYISTSKVKKISPIDAIRNGTTGERFKRKSILNLNKSKISTIGFMALNDILSGLRKFSILILTFTIGLILIIIPINTINTLGSDNVVLLFSMAESDLYISEQLTFFDWETRQEFREILNEVQTLIDDNNIPAEVFQETMHNLTILKGEKTLNVSVMQGTGITVDQYQYTQGTAPENVNEVAITHLVADKIDAKIGDTVTLLIGDEKRDFIVSAIYQSMINMGTGVRLHHDTEFDYSHANGQFAYQIKYKDNPSQKEKEERLETLKELFSDKNIQTGGEYAGDMIGGGVLSSLEGIKKLIVAVVLVINILVSVLMVKSFITKEKGEIGMLKAIGFRNSSIIYWQTARIGIILVISTILGAIISTPLAKISIEPLFKMMGASSIGFEIKPLEVYVMYPLIVLIVTVGASFMTAQQLRKISASETSNIE